jgi:branched-subunit amino acid ABC-type transport system permease component
VIVVIAGQLWTFVAGGGISAVLVGLQVFPIVIVGGARQHDRNHLAAMIIGLIDSLTTGYLGAVLAEGSAT